MITKDKLASYVNSMKEGGFLFQYGNGLIEAYNETYKSILINDVCKAGRIICVDRNSDNFTWADAELTQWAHDDDVLVQVDDNLLICVAPCDIKFIS